MRKSIKRIAFVFVLTAVAPTVGFASPTVIGFDDLTGGGAGFSLPAGYAGLNWDPEWFYWDAPQPPYNPSSPMTRIASWNYGGWIDFSPIGLPVIFEGAYFSGYDLATVHFEGYLGGSLVGTSDSLAPSSTPTFLAANFPGPVDYVNVVCQSSDYFAMDDVTFTPVPEASTLFLFGSGGMALMGLMPRLRRRKV
jgi:hypothetical protein